MSGLLLTSADVTGVVGIVPTPSLPGADRPDAVDTVDLEETVRMTEAVVASGIDILMTNGTFGEMSTLTHDEVIAFNDAVIGTVAGRIPVFTGATTLNTRDTIAIARELTALGATGLFIGRPMWLPLDDRQIVDFYGDVAAANPNSPIVAYDNPGVFKGKISSNAYEGLSKIPQIVAAKQTGGPQFADDLRAVGSAIRLLPPADGWVRLARAHPDDVTACWSGEVACGPAPLIALRDAIAERDWERAESVGAELDWACETLFPGGEISAFMQYSIQIDRAEFETAGFISPGPARAPYTTCPQSYLDGGAEVGRRWAQLQAEYASKVSV
ncbi:MAG: dihydrodipicolinate synthase family protein [Rhodococcus sp. (in: high G+C Gram-positive bacteria)]|uniref:dihydrodipicolinate synthase family protein n=1 Tax=Rhodococcus sp. TaxID=1831 RepID=UPI002ADA6589|nr:dihydrodipicolinate synthase family protein [Rhodococcus sp. (in: high G+C Gram-positive bacteria)]